MAHQRNAICCLHTPTYTNAFENLCKLQIDTGVVNALSIIAALSQFFLDSPMLTYQFYTLKTQQEAFLLKARHFK